ncbi:MAG: hypothetical protein QM498_05385 [Desulfobacterium sp.]
MMDGPIKIWPAPGISKKAADERYVKRTDMVYGARYDAVNDAWQKGILIGVLFVESDFNVFPIHEKMIRGLLTPAGEFNPLDSEDSTKLPDGSAATVDGSTGQTMVRIPAHHKLNIKDGNFRYSFVSESPFEFLGHDAYIPPIFGSDDCIYVGAYKGVAATDAVGAELISAIKDTSGYTSNPYPNPFTNRTRGQFRTQHQEGFFPHCWSIYEIVFNLFVTEYASWDTQATIPGYTGASAYSYSYVRPAGRTAGLGNASGSILADLAGVDSDLSGIVAVDEYVANSYRGIEDFFGNVWEFLDGININNTDGSCHVFVCHDPDLFADDTADGYIDTEHAPGFGDLDGYTTDLAFLSQDCAFYPSNITGGSSATFMRDYHYNSAGGWRVLLCSGHLSNGAQAGFGFLYANNASSNAHSAISARSAAKKKAA